MNDAMILVLLLLGSIALGFLIAWGLIAWQGWRLVRREEQDREAGR